MINYMLNRKVMIILLTAGWVSMSKYFPEPKYSGGRLKFEFS